MSARRGFRPYLGLPQLKIDRLTQSELAFLMVGHLGGCVVHSAFYSDEHVRLMGIANRILNGSIVAASDVEDLRRKLRVVLDRAVAIDDRERPDTVPP
jgi:predicted acyltransferase